MVTRNFIQPGDGDPRHGTWNGYHNHKCRCEACTAAWAEWHRAYMHADPSRLEKHAQRQRLRDRAKRPPST